MKRQRILFLGLVIGVLSACYDINRVRPQTIGSYLQKYPDRGIVYLTYSYENPKKTYLDALGIYRFLWNYRQARETYYLLEMDNTQSNEMVVYYTAPTVINPVDFVLSNTTFQTTMMRHNFPEQPLYVQPREVVYLGHFHIMITNSHVGFVPTTSYKILWEDREEIDRQSFFESFPQVSNWVWRKQIVQLYPSSVLPQPPVTQPQVQTAPAVPQVIYVTNVVVVTNTNQ